MQADDTSSVASYLTISFKIPEELCLNKESDLKDDDCTPDILYNKGIRNKGIAILQNERRFKSDHYGDSSPMFNEAVL